MSSDTLKIWERVSRPPASALKQIRGGRLQGMTDINPQWRYRVMTEVYGPVGVGWKWAIEKLWTEPGPAGEVMAFALVQVWTAVGEYVGEPGWHSLWSDPTPGIGGSALVAKEDKGLRANDEGYKMAVTDALSVALKCLGVASEIYEGRWDGSKYKDDGAPSGLTPPKRRDSPPTPAQHPGHPVTPERVRSTTMTEPHGDQAALAVKEGDDQLTLDGELSPEERWGRLIGPSELRSLMGLVSQHGVSTDDLKAYCLEKFGVGSRKELRIGMMPDLGQWVGAHRKGAS